MAFKPKELEQFIGRGITLPLKVVNGSVPLETGLDLIRSSIRLILNWRYGTRIMLNDFGSRLEDLFDEPNDQVSASILEDLGHDAIETWEKRVEVIDISAEYDQRVYGKMSLTIVYRVKATERVDTMVYPFYYQIPA